MATMKKDDFKKSLERLEVMAKGQLFHTGSDSDPGSWAGTGAKEENAFEPDGIDDNGTDYNGVKKSLADKVAKSQALTPAEVAIVKGTDPRPFIADKVSKGQPLTPAESWVVKGGFDKMNKGEGQAPGNAAANEMNPAKDDGEVEQQAKKSFDNAVNQSNVLQKGLEMSPLLVEFARAIGVGLEGVEARVATHVTKSLVEAFGPVLKRIDAVEKSLAASTKEQDNFNKSLADAIVGIGHQVAGTAEVAVASASAPVGPPRSQLRAVSNSNGNVQVIQKSFAGPGGLDVGEGSLAKSQIVNVMTDMVKANKLAPIDVIKYESSGELRADVQQAVAAFMQGNGR